MGIGYDSSLWMLRQVPALSERFRVVLLDNRDAGRSSKATLPYTIADIADDVAGLLDALDIQRAHLLGLSLGGMIGLEFALRHAGRLNRLVLSGTGAAPARSAFDPIHAWSWVKANDATGEVFAGEQFAWLFSPAFLRNREAVQQTVAMLTSNPSSCPLAQTVSDLDIAHLHSTWHRPEPVIPRSLRSSGPRKP
jgi:3-oxoadipate enol-lactonase